jgi:hypothetical protein
MYLKKVKIPIFVILVQNSPKFLIIKKIQKKICKYTKTAAKSEAPILFAAPI